MITQRRDATADPLRDLGGGLLAVGIEVNHHMGRLQAQANAEAGAPGQPRPRRASGVRQRLGHGLVHLGLAVYGASGHHARLEPRTRAS